MKALRFDGTSWLAALALAASLGLAGCGGSSFGGGTPVADNPDNPDNPGNPDDPDGPDDPNDPIGATPPGTPDTKTLMVDGEERSFVLYVPESASNKATRQKQLAGLPAVIILHGTTQNSGTPFQESGGGANFEWLAISEEEGVALVAPNGSNIVTGSPEGDMQTWNNCGSSPISGRSDDVAFLDAVLDAMISAGVDQDRIYVMGGSNGGKFAYRLAIEFPDRIAGIAAFAATLEIGAECAMPASPVPTMIVNGTVDPVLLASGAVSPVTSQSSTEETVAFWRTANGVPDTPVEAGDLPDTNPDDGSTVTLMKYEGGAGTAAVWHYQVNGGGHYIPSEEHEFSNASLFIPVFGRQNRDIESAREAWAFFTRD